MEGIEIEPKDLVQRMVIHAIIIMGQVTAGSVELDLDSKMEDMLSTNQIYYEGYPGSPLIPPGHKMTEQIPGYSHPYLPGSHADINVQHFLWTGTGEVGTNSVETSSRHSVGSQQSPRPSIESSSVGQGEEGNGYPTPSRHTGIEDPTLGEEHRGNVLSFSPRAGVTPRNGYLDMPKPKYLIRTVIKNGTDLLKRSVDIQEFKRDMEERLTQAYRQAFLHQSKKIKRSVRSVEIIENRRVTREENKKPDIHVKIHNIRSARPRPEIEMLYAVYKHEPTDAANTSAPVLAVDAVKAINDNVENDDAVLMLGHPLKIKAEPYEKSPSALRSNSEWLIASIILAIFLALLIIWVIVLINRQYKKDKKLHHDTPVSSIANSKYASPTAPRKGSPHSYFDNGAYTPIRQKPTSTNQDVELERGEKTEREAKQLTQNVEVAISHKVTGVHEDEESVEEKRSSGSKTPSLADHSSNNTPDSVTRSKRRTKRKDRKNSRGLGRSTLTSDEDGSDSAFPARTPDNLRQLDDLLEEDGVGIPGDSGRGSCHPGQPGWAFLPATPDEEEEEVCWQDSAMEVKQNAELYSNTLNETFPPIESIRGTRKNILESKLSDMKRGNRTRPWSAHESRWNADPMFDNKQGYFEDLTKGRKHMHYGSQVQNYIKELAGTKPS